MEQRVTYPVETALTGAPGATEIRSLSKFGLSMVTVVFQDRVPVYFARQLVTERLTEARGRLPQGLEPSLGPVATAFGEIYQYLVEGDGADLMEKKTLQDWEIRPRLRSVPGVSELNSWGGQTQQFHVVVDPRKLEKYGLSLRQLFDAVADNNVSFSGASSSTARSGSRSEASASSAAWRTSDGSSSPRWRECRSSSATWRR